MKGTVPLGELCAKFQISQSQYYKWRDQLLANGPKVFDYGGIDRSSEHLMCEIKKLKHIIGDLTVELKKSESERVAMQICSRLAKNDSEIENSVQVGYDLAKNMSWDVAVKNYLLPSLQKVLQNQYSRSVYTRANRQAS